MNKIIDNILIIKVGTSTLTKRNRDGLFQLDTESFNRIGEQIIYLKNLGYNIAIVSSAAVAAGMSATNIKVRPVNTADSATTIQTLASIGWRHVLNTWSNALDPLITGGVLVTKQEFKRAPKKSELLKVIHGLMYSGAIAIINENDAITHDDISFGDNDSLAVHFATKLKTSNLFGDKIQVVILSNINGVYKDINDSSSVIKLINDVDIYQDLAKNTTSDGGTGGMVSKFKAAKVAQNNGVRLYITHGRSHNTIKRTLDNEIGTHFSV